MFEKDFTIHSNKPGEAEAFAFKDKIIWKLIFNGFVFDLKVHIVA